MDRIDRTNISSIETFFDGLLRGKLTDNLYFTEIPPALKSDWKELVLVDCANPIFDYDGYSRGTVLITMYAKVNPYGKKDVKTLQKLEKKLNELILGSRDEFYKVSIRGRYTNYSAVNDIFYNVAQINLIIT